MNIPQIFPGNPPPARDLPWEIPGQEEFGGAPWPVKEGGEDSVETGTGLPAAPAAGRDSNMTSPRRMMEISTELR